MGIVAALSSCMTPSDGNSQSPCLFIQTSSLEIVVAPLQIWPPSGGVDGAPIPWEVRSFTTWGLLEYLLSYMYGQRPRGTVGVTVLIYGHRPNGTVGVSVFIYGHRPMGTVGAPVFIYGHRPMGTVGAPVFIPVRGPGAFY
jgi:hypothetical protein